LRVTIWFTVQLEDRPGALAQVANALAERGVNITGIVGVAEDTDGALMLTTSDAALTREAFTALGIAFDEHALVGALEPLREVLAIRMTRPLGKVFGKRVIVVGGGAQVAQVALGAVSEADRHNLRGERISVDTIPLVGEDNIAFAVRAVADLPRARMLVLAGSIMGGEISKAAEELRAVGIPIIALNMAGSVTDDVDLVVSDPVQAGTMAVMAVADTATFDLAKQRGRRY
jgi:energy-converting hydrogenase B subunit Q